MNAAREKRSTLRSSGISSWRRCPRLCEGKHRERAERLVGEGHRDLAEQVEAVEHERHAVGRQERDRGLYLEVVVRMPVRPLLPSRPSTAATDALADAHAYGSGRQVCVEQEEPGRDSQRDVVAGRSLSGGGGTGSCGGTEFGNPSRASTTVPSAAAITG